jgi:uncharacterized protein
MWKNSSALFIALLLIGISIHTTAAEAKTKPLDKAILASDSFINAHPDLMHRTRGLKAYDKLDYSEAFTHFKRGAKFSDKPSQGMVAEMLWKGEGVEINRPLAYAWMDLAAERYYPTMLLHRERYWEAMTAAEREQALVLGKDIYAAYGDAVAKPRLASALRRAKSQTTGSRTGFVGSLIITINTPSGPQTIDGSQYYQDKFWKPDEYAKWQDEAWKKPPTGRVDIGPLQSQPEAKPKEKENN